MKDPYDRKVEMYKSTNLNEFCTNRESNCKYNIFSFLPLSLIYQFTSFSNQIYLIICFSQLIKEVRVERVYSFLTPFIIFISFGIFLEGYCDLKRYFQDRLENLRKYIKIEKNGIKSLVYSCDLVVGDVIQLLVNEIVPADLVILKTDSETGDFYIKTDQLDGESDWKRRNSVKFVQKLKIENIFNSKICCYCENPSSDINSFNGLLSVENDENEITEEKLSVDNTAWKGSRVVSEYIIGMVIYTGKDTKSQMSKNNGNFKRGVFDREINNVNIICFTILLLVSYIFLFLKGVRTDFLYCFLSIFKFFILFSGIFPMSLKVNIDGGKVISSFLISYFKQFEGINVNNTNIPEELGRVQIIMCDKTGTLTKNELKFKKYFSKKAEFDENNFSLLKDELLNIYSGNTVKNIDNEDIKHLIYSLLLCNNVYPENKNKNEVTKFYYKSSNADDLELAKFTQLFGFNMISRSKKEILIRNCVEKEEKFEILFEFPFKSELRRMGIILKNQSDNKIYFYLKGSDSTIIPMLKEIDRKLAKSKSDLISTEGLRSLLICYKELSQTQLNYFMDRFIIEEQNNFQNYLSKDAYLNGLRKSIENEMNFIGTTGVVDTLQENVEETIELCFKAGIKFWMITGDKAETALNISKICNLNKNREIIEIIAENLENFSSSTILLLNKIKTSDENSFSLLIDGKSFEILIKNEIDFLEVCNKCISVIVCRCSPAQKYLITKKYKEVFDKVIMCVGDGGNDVPMIQEANIGIGIKGKEGNQAALASDFSINHFKDLKYLIFYLGGNSYKNAVSVVLYIIHRGFIQAIMQMYFTYNCDFKEDLLFNSILVTFLTTIYTNLTCFTFFLDSELDIKDESNYADKYIEIQKGKCLNYKYLFILLLQTIYQSTVLYFSCKIEFNGNYLNVKASCFICLVISEFIYLYFNVDIFHWMISGSFLISIISFIITLTTFGPLLGLVKFGFIEWLKMIIFSVFSVLPFIIYRTKGKIRKFFQKKIDDKRLFISETIN